MLECVVYGFWREGRVKKYMDLLQGVWGKGHSFETAASPDLKFGMWTPE
jgi:hypothetical protein